MLVNSEKQGNKSEALKQPELNQVEHMVIRLFRQLDDQGRKDIIRFLDALLAAR